MLNTSKDLLTTGTLNVVGDLRYEAWYEIMKWDIFFNSDILYHEMQEQLQKNGFFENNHDILFIKAQTPATHKNYF